MGFAMPMDVCEMNDEYLIRAAIPGVRPEDLDISVKENSLTITGEVREPQWQQMQEGQTPASSQQPMGSQQPSGQQQQQAGGQSAGRREQGSTPRGESVHCWLQEIPYGRFSRSVTLPMTVNASKARAEFDNGLLVLHLPKTEEAKPRRIEVQPGQRERQLSHGSSTTGRGQ
jgi:HSP20 family protein